MGRMFEESFLCFDAVTQNLKCSCPPDDVVGNEKGNYCHSHTVKSVGKETPSSKLVQVFNHLHYKSDDEQQNKPICTKRLRTITVASEMVYSHVPSINTSKIRRRQLMNFLQVPLMNTFYSCYKCKQPGRYQGTHALEGWATSM